MDSSFIKDIGRSYIVSSLIPASIFVSLAILIFPNPFTQVTTELEKPLLFENAGIMYLVLTGWLGFVLYSSEDWIAKLFEGYFLPDWGIFRYLQRRWYNKTTKRCEQLKSQHARAASTETQDAENEPNSEELRQRAIAELQPLEIRTPLDRAYLLPTTLGNVLRASEIYPQERYGMDGITLWPRLHNVLPEEFVAELEDQNNRLAFMLNSSFLACLLAFTSLYVSAIRQLNWGFPNASAAHYLKLALGFLIACYILYRIGANVAEGYGLLVRAGFDLYRFKLLAALKQPMPEDLEEERDTWEILSEFYIAGEKLGKIKLRYKHGDGSQTDATPAETD